MSSILRQLPNQRVISSIQKASRSARNSVSTIGIRQQAYPCLASNQLRLFHNSSQTLDNKNALPPPSDIYDYSEEIKKMTNEELNDASTIPGFTTLIHSPPRDKTATPRNALVGKVVSDKMTKTVNVEIERYKIVPKYRKRVKYSKKFMAHDEEEVCSEGDMVMIVPCQRISRKKHFRVHEIIRKMGI